AAGLVRHPTPAVVLLSLACFINDMAIPVIWAVSADVGGRFAGTVAGFMNMVGGLGGMITPLLIPALHGSLPGPVLRRWPVLMALPPAPAFVRARPPIGIDPSEPPGLG